MAKLADGTYIIRNGANPALALDCVGGGLGNGANIQVYTANASDAQYVTVWTMIDGSRRLVMSKSGKALDVESGHLASGSNVWQYDVNNSPAQAFKIEEVLGKQINIDGKSHTAYKIRSYSKPSLLIECAGTGAPTSGTNLVLSTDEGGALDQIWAFVSVNTLPQGTYTIRSALDPKIVAGIAWESKANGARAMVSAYNGHNHQIFWVKDFAQSGYAHIIPTHSMKYLDALGRDQAGKETPVDQWSLEDVRQNHDPEKDMRWLIVPAGSMQYEGTFVPTYEVHNTASSGETLCLDIIGANTRQETNLQLYPQNNTLAQRWIFDRADMLAEGVSTVSEIRLNGSSNVQGRGALTLTPTWKGEGESYQARYRIRMQTPEGSLSSWMPFQSLADGSVANSGWGAAGLPNVVTKDGVIKGSPYPIKLLLDSQKADYAEIEIQVRRYMKNYMGKDGLNAHGPEIAGIFHAVLVPVLTIKSVSWSVNGLDVAYESDYKHDGNSISITCVTGGKKLCAYTATGQPHTWHIVIPNSELNFIPESGDKVNVNANLTTDRGGMCSVAVQLTLSAETNHGLSVTGNLLKEKTHFVGVTKAHSTSECFLLFGDRMEACDRLSDQGGNARFLISPPLETDWRVCFLSKTDSGSWGAHTTPTQRKVACAWRIWTYVKDGSAVECALGVGKGDAPSETDSHTPESTTAVTSGRMYPIYRFGVAERREITASGAYIKENFVHDSAADNFKNLAKANHAIYRTPTGLWERVAVLSVDTSGGIHSSLYGTVSVKMGVESI